MSGVSGPLARAKTFLFICPHGQVVKGLDCQSEFGENVRKFDSWELQRSYSTAEQLVQYI